MQRSKSTQVWVIVYSNIWINEKEVNFMTHLSENDLLILSNCKISINIYSMIRILIRYMFKLTNLIFQMKILLYI